MAAMICKVIPLENRKNPKHCHRDSKFFKALYLGNTTVASRNVSGISEYAQNAIANLDIDIPDGEPLAKIAPKKAPKGSAMCNQGTTGDTKFREISFSLELDITISDKTITARRL